MQENNRFEILYKDSCPKNIHKKISLNSFEIIKDNSNKKTYLHITGQSHTKFLTISQCSLAVKTESRYRQYTINENIPPNSVCFEDEVIDVTELLIKEGEAISVTVKPKKYKKNIILPIILLVVAVLTFFIFSQIQAKIKDSMQEKASKKRPEIVNTTTSPALNMEEKNPLYENAPKPGEEKNKEDEQEKESQNKENQDEEENQNINYETTTDAQLRYE